MSADGDIVREAFDRGWAGLLDEQGLHEALAALARLEDAEEQWSEFTVVVEQRENLRVALVEVEAQRDTLAKAMREIRDLRLKHDSDSERAVNDARMTMREIARAALTEAGLDG